MNEPERPFQDQVTLIEQYSEQLRAKAMDGLFARGVEYTEAMSEIITEAIQSAQEEGNVNKELFATLAEIGWCDVFCRHARTIEDDDATPDEL